jgi:hypothetical protein
MNSTSQQPTVAVNAPDGVEVIPSTEPGDPAAFRVRCTAHDYCRTRYWVLMVGGSDELPRAYAAMEQHRADMERWA